MTAARFLESATRILFFTGKGGVGKTSVACAAGLELSRRGQRVLLASTDPASNLDEVLGIRLGGEPTAIPGAGGLFALNIDPETAAAAYRQRVIGPFRNLLPSAAIQAMEEQLSGACTVEIAAFDQFTQLLAGSGAGGAFDHLIFDTAPTGHTLRLLKLPAAWTGFLQTNTTGTSCLGPLGGLEAKRDQYQASLRILSDAAATTLVLVARPEASALAEAERTRAELAALGMRRQVLVLNGVFRTTARDDSGATAFEERCNLALANIPKGLSELPRISVPLLAEPPMGIRGLGAVWAGHPSSSGETVTDPVRPVAPGLSALIDRLARAPRGVIFAMGKGGVGKTTVASAIAVELASRGHSVHLTTTDPAAHIQDAVSTPVDRLRLSRIDPALETRRYTDEVLAKAAPQLDSHGLALLEEDLRSPCTEEIAVFRAFAEAVAASDSDFVVIDTAPTGHTLLLLDAAEAYHREVSRMNRDVPQAVRRLLPLLRDPAYTRILLVTVPEATPVHEAARLQADLRRAHIEPFAWIVNQSLSAAGWRDPLLARRAAQEAPYIDEVRTNLSTYLVLVPWVASNATGPAALRNLARSRMRSIPAEVHRQ